MRVAASLGLGLGMLAVCACGTDGSDAPTGPLAVVLDPGEGKEAALVSGTLRIDDRCVAVDTDDGAVGLAWRAGRTRRIEPDGAVEFTDSAGETVVVRDGDMVAVGGGEVSAEAVDWVSEPHPDCVAASDFRVDDLTLEP